MDSEFRRKLESVINKYINGLQAFEKSFRSDMSRRIGVSADRLYTLPQDMYYVVSGLQNEYWMHEIFMSEDNQYARDYYNKTMESFKKSGIKELSQDEENGVIFESLLVQALKDEPGFTVEESSQPLHNVKTTYDFEGVGFQKRHGDIAFVIQGMKIPILIDAKYSTDRSQIISRTGEKFNDTSDLDKQITLEINRGLAESIAFNKTDGPQWINSYVEALKAKDAGDIELSKEIFRQGISVPKILIYIFKDRGMWSSQVVEDLRDDVINNALTIKKHNNHASIGGAYSKDWLWYGRTKR